MKVLVCGGRHYDDEEWIFDVLNNYDSDHDVTEIIQGGAGGADSAALKWAKVSNIPHRTFNADWKRHGASAGPMRNAEMLTVGKPELVIAFPGGKGTKNMIEQARQAGVEVIEIST